MLKIYILDDEAKSIEITKNKLKRNFPHLNIVGYSQNPDVAIEEIKNLTPDLLFLDVEMPRFNGFEVLKRIPQTEVIFTTAYDKYAIKALNQAAIGYLLKPVDETEFIESVNRAILSIQKKETFIKNNLLLNNIENGSHQKILVPFMEGLEIISVDDILYLEGENGYTKIHLKDGKNILSSYYIGKYKYLTENTNFYQCHKSYIINVNEVKKYLNKGIIVLSNDNQIPISKQKKTDFMSKIKSVNS